MKDLNESSEKIQFNFFVGIIPSETKLCHHFIAENIKINEKLNIKSFTFDQRNKMYNLTTNREIMSPSERIENAEASCESINDHIDSIGEF